jgi:hypothetical protein
MPVAGSMKTIIIAATNLAWVVPTDFDPFNYQMHAIAGGAGGGGGDTSVEHPGTGGGGGAYSYDDSFHNLPTNLIPGNSTIAITIGQGGAGGTAFVQAPSGGNTQVQIGTHVYILAVGGSGGTWNGTGGVGLGGPASLGIGFIRFSGGNGGPIAANPPPGVTQFTSGVGGGAAGPLGAGGTGGLTTGTFTQNFGEFNVNSTLAVGGAGENRSPPGGAGAFGWDNSVNGLPGGNGADWQSSIDSSFAGPGGGAAGVPQATVSNGDAGGAGGLYGGGGGGGGNGPSPSVPLGGPGAQGVVVVIYRIKATPVIASIIS